MQALMDKNEKRARRNEDDEEDDDVGETDLAATAELGDDSDARPLFEKLKKSRKNMQPVRNGPTTLAGPCLHMFLTASMPAFLAV